MRLLLFSCASIVAAVIGSGTVQAQDSTGVARGKALVVKYCSGCHAVELTGNSPHTKAPPFRTLSERFPIDALEETFIGTIDTGHPGMPVFKASQDQIDAIVAYIASVMQ